MYESDWGSTEALLQPQAYYDLRISSTGIPF